MYISIQAGITDITLESLDGYKIYTKNNTKISGLDGWYLLTTSNVQINDILINNESIGELIHTGYIKNNSFHINYLIVYLNNILTLNFEINKSKKRYESFFQLL